MKNVFVMSLIVLISTIANANPQTECELNGKAIPVNNEPVVRDILKGKNIGSQRVHVTGVVQQLLGNNQQSILITSGDKSVRVFTQLYNYTEYSPVGAIQSGKNIEICGYLHAILERPQGFSTEMAAGIKALIVQARKQPHRPDVSPLFENGFFIVDGVTY